MRLPQSSFESFSFHLVVGVILVFVWIAALPLCVQATTAQLSSSPTSIDFGNVTVGQTQTQVVVLTNGETTSVTIWAVTVSSFGLSVSGINLPLTLAAGERTTFAVTFTPPLTGLVSGEVSVTSSASNPSLQIPVTGTGVQLELLAASPSSVSFGNVAVGTTASVPVVLTNENSSAVTLTAFSGSGNGFSASGPKLPATMQPGTSLTIHVLFTPAGTGLTGGDVLIEGPLLDIPLTGTGTPAAAAQLTITPATLAFGSLDVGKTATQVSTVTATGGSVTISSAQSSNSEFEISGPSFPLTISAGHSTQLDIVFAPTTGGAASGTLTLTSNASKKQTTESLTGTGVSAQTPPSPQYTVELSWNPSTSLVVGYNVYRGTAVGSYRKINAALESNTSYTDSTVVSGTTYYYAATAVNASGEESSYSEPLKVEVP